MKKNLIITIVSFVIAIVCVIFVFPHNLNTDNQHIKIIVFMLVWIFTDLGEYHLIKILPERYKRIKYLFIVQNIGVLVFVVLSAVILSLY